ncbi:MAG TPA: SDR family oxidoreductase [Dehalococcoidales bacterium]|nr:SDR family oxidoreductase [Dehalococcoidales bacterium]
MSPDKISAPLNEIFSLKNKCALITGGASGIGYASAYRLAEAGASVAIVDFNTETGRAAAQKLAEAGYKAIFLRADVSREEEVVTAVKDAAVSLGGLDILVNNAGIFPATPLAGITESDLTRIMAVNLHGLVYFCREAARFMSTKTLGGSIVNITSVDALHPIRPNMSVYDASKGAVLSITRSLARELAAENIRVNAVAPGGILTEGAIADRSGVNSRAGLRETLARIPLKRMGTADDVARAVLFLACDMSTYMTGSLVVVDGGFLVS